MNWALKLSFLLIILANKLTRKRVMRRKNAVRRIQIHDEFAIVNNFNAHNYSNEENFATSNIGLPKNDLADDYDGDDSSKLLLCTKTNHNHHHHNHNSSLLQQQIIVFTTNPSYHRIYSIVKQAFIWQNFLKQYSISSSHNNQNVTNRQSSMLNANNNLINQIAQNANNPQSFVDRLLFDEEFKQQQFMLRMTKQKH